MNTSGSSTTINASGQSEDSAVISERLGKSISGKGSDITLNYQFPKPVKK